jgi:hypothetical protein
MVIEAIEDSDTTRYTQFIPASKGGESRPKKRDFLKLGGAAVKETGSLALSTEA